MAIRVRGATRMMIAIATKTSASTGRRISLALGFGYRRLALFSPDLFFMHFLARINRVQFVLATNIVVFVSDRIRFFYFNGCFCETFLF